MFLIKHERPMNEANEKSLQPVCTVYVQKIFALLHAQAVQAAAGKGVLIENTAADGNDAKTAVFHSAGEHMIVARAKEQGEKIARDAAVAGIREYVKVFCGEDVSNGLKDDEFFELSEDGPEADVSESVPSFSVFLSEATGIDVIAESDEAQDAEGEDAAGSADDEDEMGDEDDNDEAGENDPGDEAGENDPGDEAGEIDPPPEEGEDPKKQKKDGFYILYGLKIKGLKETTVSDALKQWGSNFLKGFGVKIDSLWGPGGSGEVHTIGGLVKGLKDIFGAIDDPEELEDRIDKAIRQKYPNLSRQTVEFRDKKTLVNDLDVTKRQGYDTKVRQKIMSADYSLYIKVEENDPLQPVLNRKAIANLVTMQIKGLFKKFKNLIKADDVIYLKGAALQKANPDAIKKLEDRIPTYDEVEKPVMDDKHTFQDVYNALEKLFDSKISGNPIYKDSQKCKNALSPWERFKKKYPTSRDLAAAVAITDDNTQKKRASKERAFDRFLKAYKDMFDNDFEDDDELTVDEDHSIFTAYDMLTEMFGNSRWNETALRVFEKEADAQDAGEPSAEKREQGGQAETPGAQTDQKNSPGQQEGSGDNAAKLDDETEVKEPDDEKHGDDLYIIPMPGVTFEKGDEHDMRGV